MDKEWATRNRSVVVVAANNLYQKLCPSHPKPLHEILSTVETWAFQPETSDVDWNVVEEDSTLSFVRSNPSQSFLDIRNQLAGDEQSVAASLPLNEERTMLSPGLPTTSHVFEGESFRLEIRK